MVRPEGGEDDLMVVGLVVAVLAEAVVTTRSQEGHIVRVVAGSCM